MPHQIIDTNVALTASGTNSQASKECQRICISVIRQVLSDEVLVIIDDNNEVLREYRQNIYPDHKGSLAEQFMIHALTNQFFEGRVKRIKLEKNAFGQYADYPDNDDNWTTNDVRCKRFDPDDKKWVALALRFKSETGTDAPIVNAADRCWIAFAAQLQSVGVALEILCRDER